VPSLGEVAFALVRKIELLRPPPAHPAAAADPRLPIPFSPSHDDGRFMFYSPTTGKPLMPNYYSFREERFSFTTAAGGYSYLYDSYVVASPLLATRHLPLLSSS
jgi:hypothetical protein